MRGYFSVEHRRERLEDQLSDEQDRLGTLRLFQRNHGGRAARIRAQERRIGRLEDKLARFIAKHPTLDSDSEGRAVASAPPTILMILLWPIAKLCELIGEGSDA